MGVVVAFMGALAYVVRVYARLVELGAETPARNPYVAEMYKLALEGKLYSRIYSINFFCSVNNILSLYIKLTKIHTKYLILVNGVESLYLKRNFKTYIIFIFFLSMDHRKTIQIVNGITKGF